jgi:hypothetical protein
MRLPLAGLVAGCLLPGLVLALSPDQLPEIELFIAGSSAQDESLENLMRLKDGLDGTPNICQEGSLEVYRARVDDVRKRAFYCLASEHIRGIAEGTRIAVHKSSGGSGEGVSPLAAQTGILFIDLARLPDRPDCLEPARVLYTGDLAAYSLHRNCSGSSKSVAPLAGISDIEPALITTLDEELVTRSRSQLVWGLPVTKNLRNALQALQGLVDADVPHDHPLRETEAAMPTLSHTQVASIFAGTIGSWAQFLDSDGTPIPESAFLADSPPDNRDLAGTSPGAYRPDADNGRSIYLCRRIASSGTQAAYEIHYLRSRCLVDAPRFVAPDDGSDIRAGGSVANLVNRPDPAGRVFAGVSSSDVRSCLDAHEQHNRWAIGMLSTEVLGNNASSEFRHIRVDGHAPTLRNAREGRWLHVSEPTIQWRKRDAERIAQSPEGQLLAFIVENIGQPRVIRSLNSGFVHPWGQGGYLALATSNAAGMDDEAIAGLSKTFDGEVRNCNVPLLTVPSSIDFSPLE